MSVLGLLSAFAVFAGGDIIQGVVVDDSGGMSIGGVAARLIHFDWEWRSSVQNSRSLKNNAGYPVFKNGYFANKAKWTLTGGNSFELNQQIKKLNQSTFKYNIDLTAPRGIPTKTLCLSMVLPVEKYAGKELSLGYEKYVLPTVFGKQIIVESNGIGVLTIYGGRHPIDIKGKNLGVLVQDNRKYGRDEFELRIMCDPPKEKILQAGLALTIEMNDKLRSKVKTASGAGIKVDEKGIIEFDNVNLLLRYFDKTWNVSDQRGADFEVSSRNADSGNIDIKAKWFLKSNRAFFDVNEKISRTGPVSWDYTVNLKSASGIPTSSLSASIEIPAGACAGQIISFDGAKFKLPSKYEKMALLNLRNVKKIILYVNSQGMAFEGNMNIALQDNRKFNSDVFELRIMANPGSGDITDSTLKFKMSRVAFKSEPLSIKKQANMAFRDDVADDRKGGWTDQGPENDLRMLKPGLRNIGGVTFDIIDPKTNNNKSCLVFSHENRDYFLNSVDIAPSSEMNRYLYLLHAVAWPPEDKVGIGKIHVDYTDGTSSDHEVVNKRDVANWWEPVSLPNGVPVWTGENKQSYVGLYLSRFALNGKNIKKISLIPRKNAVWMVVAASLSDDEIPVNGSRPPYYIVPGRNWKKVADPGMKIVPGSALDFSFMLDAPAGKYGPIVIRDGHFEFEKLKGRKVRFYGNNLCFTAQYLEKRACEKLADQFAAIGYNSVRFHHYDDNLIDHKSGNSTTIDAGMMDKLDYLFYCFKKKGIYITTDLYCSRRFKAGEIKGFGNISHYEMKALAPINEDAFNNWKEFSRKLLTHKNRYTGTSWAEDPALFGISVVNEDTIYHSWQQYPAIKNAYLKKFEQFLKDKGVICKNDAERSRILSKFLIDLQIKSYLRMKAFLKDELKVKAQLTDANFYETILVAPLREKLDYVDNHAYWDHPAFVGKMWHLPHRYRNISVIKQLAQVPRTMMPTRILGKPFMVTEFNYCFPNEYRAEGGVLMGAYAALQDWDGLYRFAYSHNLEGVIYQTRAQGFDLASDPLNMLSEKIGILLFLRGDVSVSKQTYPFFFGENSFANAKSMFLLHGGGFPESYSKLGLYGKIGTVNEKYAKQYDKKDQGAAPEIGNDSITSSTGELKINREKVAFSAVTPNSEIFIANLPGTMSGRVVKATVNGGFCVVGAASADSKPLEKSGRVLLFHLTDIQNNKIKFMSARKKVLLEWGNLPLLIKRGEASVSLRHNAFKKAKAWALAFNGRRISEVPVSVNEQGVTINCSTFDHGTMVYEITFD